MCIKSCVIIIIIDTWGVTLKMVTAMRFVFFQSPNVTMKKRKQKAKQNKNKTEEKTQ